MGNWNSLLQDMRQDKLSHRCNSITIRGSPPTSPIYDDVGANWALHFSVDFICEITNFRLCDDCMKECLTFESIKEDITFVFKMLHPMRCWKMIDLHLLEDIRGLFVSLQYLE